MPADDGAVPSEVAKAAPRRTSLIVFLIAGTALAVMLVVYTILHRPPRLPRDADHLKPQSAEDCLSCHGPGKISPRKPNHPPVQGQCLNCHEGA